MALFEKTSATTDVKKVDAVTPSPVAAENSGEDTAANGGKSEERRFNGFEMETIVKDRLAREQKKFAKREQELQSQLAELKKVAPDKQVNPNIEAEWQSKLAAYETQNRTLAEQLGTYRE